MVLDGGVWLGYECFKLRFLISCHAKFNLCYVFSFHGNKMELGIPALLSSCSNNFLELLATACLFFAGAYNTYLSWNRRDPDDTEVYITLFS